jgi:hypothetical protein
VNAGNGGQHWPFSRFTQVHQCPQEPYNGTAAAVHAKGHAAAHAAHAAVQAHGAHAAHASGAKLAHVAKDLVVDAAKDKAQDVVVDKVFGRDKDKSTKA